MLAPDSLSSPCRSAVPDTWTKDTWTLRHPDTWTSRHSDTQIRACARLGHHNTNTTFYDTVPMCTAAPNSVFGLREFNGLGVSLEALGNVRDRLIHGAYFLWQVVLEVVSFQMCVLYVYCWLLLTYYRLPPSPSPSPLQCSPRSIRENRRSATATVLSQRVSQSPGAVSSSRPYQ